MAEITFLNSGKVLPSGYPFSEAVKVDNTLYLSGMIGIIPGTNTLAPGGLEAETNQMMENIKIILEAHSYTLADLVKCQVMLADIAEWQAFNAVYASFFENGRYPARSGFAAAGLALNARVEIDCIAARS